jgi:hypothetical protein
MVLSCSARTTECHSDTLSNKKGNKKQQKKEGKKGGVWGHVLAKNPRGGLSVMGGDLKFWFCSKSDLYH